MRSTTSVDDCSRCSQIEGQLARQQWMMRVLEKQRLLLPGSEGVPLVQSITSEEFLRDFYAANRPVLIAGRVAEWPAVKKWTPSYLMERIGSAPVELQLKRGTNPAYERARDLHRGVLPFDQFIAEAIKNGSCNDSYITASNSASNAEVFKSLHEDLGFVDELLSPDWQPSRGMVWLGPKGTFTPLHFDNINVLFLQLVGTKRFVLAPPSETAKLYNDYHVYSSIADIGKPGVVQEFPEVDGVVAYEVCVNPGDALFIPVTWWHQVEALEFSVSISHTNFLWDNHTHVGFPG